MVELTESALVMKITNIDAEIDKITAVLGTAGTGAVQNLKYKIGDKMVDGNQRLEQLMKIREVYQKLLNSIPRVITRDHGYEIVPGTGEDKTEYIGDE